MKVCPACRTTFEDSLNFCLNDGTPLVIAETHNEPETVVSGREIPVTPKQPPPPVQREVYVQPPTAPTQQPVQKKSKTGLIVALTALTAILLGGALVAGYFMMSKNNNQVAQVNVNANQNPRNTRNSNAGINVSNQNANSANANAQANAATRINANISSPLPTPAPTVSSEDAEGIRNEVTDVLDSWVGALESNNLNAHLNYYADTVDYYKGRYSRNQIRADKQRAFQEFDNLEMDVSNIRVTPDPSGDKATVVYDKEWNFEGADKRSEGKVQSQLTLQKIGGRWRITGEKDLRVY